MKDLANSFAQLAAIVMILITLALSTAAVGQLTAVAADAGDAPQAAALAPAR